MQIALWVGVEARRPEFPPRGGGPFVLTDAIRPLIEACWAQDARARPSFEDAVGTVTRIIEADDDADADDADVAAFAMQSRRCADQLDS